ncbi:uncharacterized protein LOC126390922 [Epinephelus moara]|uniref:uncharacterized protein LOC126390922 n=1 Tax=Epinephelus moara TaxID=300413 RepID=UPI00214E34B1|nr:uncharacterized protein LOC126390922 [Epinephelus moara]
MDGLRIFLVILLGVAHCRDDWISESELEVTVTPGDNITLYCDYKLSSGELIVWYRDCSHENQPSLVLKLNRNVWRQSTIAASLLNPLPRFHFVRNYVSDSYDLLIVNVTDSDEGLYYCGSEQKQVEDKGQITSKNIYRYGTNTTRIITVLNSTEPYRPITQDSGVCWMLLFSLCPAFVVLVSPLSSLLVYHLSQRKEKEPQVHQKRPSTRDQARRNQDEDVFLTRVVYWAQDG